MTIAPRAVFSAISLAILIIPSLRAAQIPWKSITPEQAGLDGAALNAWKDALASHGTSGLLVIRRGSVAFEWYAPNSGVDKPHGTASLAKALVGGMSLLVAMSDGLIKPDDLASKYIPEWRTPPKSKITIRQLATHTSGIEDAEQDSLPHDQLPGWKGAFWKRSPDPFSIALQAPVIFEPGSSYAYSNPGMAALAYAVTASLKPGDIRSVLKARVFDPLGIPEKGWSIGYGRGYELDGLTLYANWGGAAFTARAVARVGQLMMLQGRWSGRELVSRSAVKEVASYAGMPRPSRTTDQFAPASGLAWYTNSDGVWPGVPRDTIAGAGAGHQVLVVIPSLDLVVVRNGDAMDTSGRSEFWTPVYENILQPLMAAVKERAPYPRSPVIRDLTFLPDIHRAALDSDNWPITWGDDDAQYTSYGDGWGFDPRTEHKLGMGFARIIGPPDHFEGFNLRSDGERMGDGAKSSKASGILMVDGVLYLLVRNVGNSQLLWSSDHGRTWQSGFKLETGFGSPTFLNYGRNYRGAPDDFVYIYSQDGPSAYESDNQLELARVSKRRIKDRAAWEFLKSVDESGRAVWTSDIAQHGAVFTYPANCRRSDVVYNPGIRRYLLALAYNAAGDWGIFDAPEPWGPWTTVFHNDDAWRIPRTHGYRLPAKWFSRDGLTMTLIFSGVRLKDATYDAFCTRTMQLRLRR